ncbi:MAG: hypothetical protein JNM75_14795 [Rhodospirillales bacterium]|nr:hypothetical protein [Rhodospirillales bacterium]
MATVISSERDRWSSILEEQFAPAETGLHLGELRETEWNTIWAEFLDAQNNVFMIAEVDEETRTLLRCRRPSGPAARRN